MTQLTQDRLTAALRARAGQVHVHDLRGVPDPAPATPSRWRLYPGLVAATVAAVALPLLLTLGGSGGHLEKPGADPRRGPR